MFENTVHVLYICIYTCFDKLLTTLISCLKTDVVCVREALCALTVLDRKMVRFSFKLFKSLSFGNCYTVSKFSDSTPIE